MVWERALLGSDAWVCETVMEELRMVLASFPSEPCPALASSACSDRASERSVTVTVVGAFWSLRSATRRVPSGFPEVLSADEPPQAVARSVEQSRTRRRRRTEILPG
jgi:hypothetical protein